MAETSTLNLTEELMDLISMEMLIQPDDQYVFFNNGPIQTADAELAVPGVKKLKFNRPELPTGTFTEASRRLVDGTPISTTAIAISMTQVELETREYAGPHDGTSVKPFGVTEFLRNRARHSVVALIGEFLRRDYNRWQDTVILNLLLAATTVVTPDGSAVGAITAGQVASVDWLRALNKNLKDRKIPTFGNGRYRLWVNTRDELNLKRDADYKEATRYLAAGNPIFHGHVASLEGFDIGVSTRLPTANVGASGAVTGFQSVAYGPYGIGYGRTLDPSVRRADDTDYGRSEKVIWKSEEAVGTLYADMLTRCITT